MEKLCFKIAVIAFILVASGSIKAQDANKVVLRLRLQPNQSWLVRTDFERHIEVKLAPGERATTTETIGLDYIFTVLSVDNAQAKVKVTYREVRLPADAPPIDLSGVVGQSFFITYTPDGQVTHVRGTELILERSLDKVQIPAGADRAALKTLFAEVFDHEAIEAAIHRLAVFFAPQPVGVSDSWRHQSTVTAGTPMMLNQTWTLRSRQNKTVTLNLRSEITPHTAFTRQGALTVSYRLTGTQQGTVSVNESTGWMLSGELRQSFAGRVTTRGSSTPASRPLQGTSLLRFAATPIQDK